MTAHLLEVSGVTITAPGGRTLFDGLDLRLARDHVALIGRNGAGKSTLLAALAGVAHTGGPGRRDHDEQPFRAS